MHNEATAVGRGDADVTPEADRLLEGGIRPAVELVLAGDALRVLGGVGGDRDRARGRGIVVVEKFRQERPEAELPASARVVGDEDTELLVRNEGEVGVEPARVAAVTDDPQSVARLLVEA